MSRTQNPSIRFCGFSNTWEQRKAKEVFIATADKGHPELPVLSATQDRGMIKRDENNINIFHEKKNEEGYKRVVPGQFVIHLRSFQGGFSHSAIEGITSPAYTIFGFQEPDNHDDNYWKYVFTSKEFIRQLETVTYGIRDGRSISYDEFLTMSFLFPKKEEQAQIAVYLDTITDLIILHQCKYEKLQDIKASMLDKMFPKNGEDVPEVRFKGFTGAWKYKKFSELYDSVSQKNDLTYGVDKNITVATMQYRPEIKVTDIEYLKTYNVFKMGDIAFEGHQSKEFRYGRFVENDIGDGIISHIFVVFRPKIDYDLKFWKYAINYERLMRPILACCTKASTMMNDLVAKDFLDESILVPSIEEQRKIGTALAEIDNLILLQQQELSKLQSIKKALLEKMFV